MTPATNTRVRLASGRPAASSSGARRGVVVTTASRYPGFSAGLITLGLHTTFHVEWIRCSVNTPS